MEKVTPSQLYIFSQEIIFSQPPLPKLYFFPDYRTDWGDIYLFPLFFHNSSPFLFFFPKNFKSYF